MRRYKGKMGFTLMELLVVITIIAILTGLLLPAVVRIKEKARITKAAATIEALKVALSMFHQDYGYYPPSYEGSQRNGNSFNPAFNTTLVEALMSTDRNGPYYEFKGSDIVYQSGTTDPVYLDPWGNAYIYVRRIRTVSEGNTGPYHPYDDSTAEDDLDRNTYNIYSLGPDGVTNGGAALPSDWDDTSLYNNADDGDWASTNSSSDGQYDDINSWDGRPRH